MEDTESKTHLQATMSQFPVEAAIAMGLQNQTQSLQMHVLKIQGNWPAKYVPNRSPSSVY
jgi:hypothetical protein